MLFADSQRFQLWRKYMFLTKDFGFDSENLLPFDRATLDKVQIPEDWHLSEALAQFSDELVARELHDSSPYDLPPPPVVFPSRTFVFTGKFSYGTRSACQQAVTAKGGSSLDGSDVSHLVHYLVVGGDGSKAWKHGTYGNKIQTAILARREYGTPAIISEKHWAEALVAL